MGRVVFTGSAKPVIDWSGIESRLQDISAPSNSSAPSIKPIVSVVLDPTQCGSDVASLSSHQADDFDIDAPSMVAS